MILNLSRIGGYVMAGLTLVVAFIALMMAMRSRSTWTASAGGTRTTVTTTTAETPGRRITTETRKTVTEWVELPTDEAEPVSAAGDDTEHAEGTSTTRPTPTARSAARMTKKVTPRREPSALARCDQAGHELTVKQNGKATYVTCHECRQHATWLPDVEMPNFQVFGAATEVLLRQSWIKMMNARARGTRASR